MPDTESTPELSPPNPWPPASMGELITMCSSPALIGLGIMTTPGQEEPEVDLHLARHFIDLLALLDEKTADQLDEAEQQSIEQALHELRMAFVQIQQASLEQADASADPPPQAHPEGEDEVGNDTETDPADTPEPQAPVDQEPAAETPGDSETAEDG